MNKKNLFYIKGVIWILALLPLARLFWFGYNDNLTANPIEFVERSTGTWALIFLLVTLSVTPVRLLTGMLWQVPLRRMLGLWMFFYACLHITTYLWLDYSFLWSEIVLDIIEHPYVIVGFSAFVLTIPLAITSNNAMIRRLKSNWKKLHKLVYVIAILGVLHFWWLVKKDVTEPFYYAFALSFLLGVRVYFKYKAKKTMNQKRNSAPNIGASF